MECERESRREKVPLEGCWALLLPLPDGYWALSCNLQRDTRTLSVTFSGRPGPLLTPPERYPRMLPSPPEGYHTLSRSSRILPRPSPVTSEGHLDPLLSPQSDSQALSHHLLKDTQTCSCPVYCQLQPWNLPVPLCPTDSCVEMLCLDWSEHLWARGSCWLLGPQCCCHLSPSPASFAVVPPFLPRHPVASLAGWL